MDSESWKDGDDEDFVRVPKSAVELLLFAISANERVTSGCRNMLSMMSDQIDSFDAMISINDKCSSGLRDALARIKSTGIRSEHLDSYVELMQSTIEGYDHRKLADHHTKKMLMSWIDLLLIQSDASTDLTKLIRNTLSHLE